MAVGRDAENNIKSIIESATSYTSNKVQNKFRTNYLIFNKKCNRLA